MKWADNMRDYVRKTAENPLHIRPILGRLDMELTERCNNNCIHCYINQPEDDCCKGEELTTSEIQSILTQAVSLGCLSIRFTGGEPLLRDDFEEIYLFARRLGLKVVIFTNGTLINPHLADLFVRVPPLEKIEVSVYGMSRRSCEAVTRTPGSFQAAMKGIDLLRQKEIPFVVKAPVLPPNETEMAEFDAWASSIPWMEERPVYTSIFDLRARRDCKEKNELIKMLRLHPEKVVEIISSDEERYVQEMYQFCSKFLRVFGDGLFTCGAGLSACIDAYGKVQPCMLLRHPGVVYDLRTVSLKEVLVELFPRLRKMKAQNPDYIVRCSRCFLRGLCEQCPAKSWMEHGVLDKPVDYLCQVAHALAFDLGLLEEGENAWEIEEWGERIKITRRSH